MLWRARPARPRRESISLTDGMVKFVLLLKLESSVSFILLAVIAMLCCLGDCRALPQCCRALPSLDAGDKANKV